MLYLLCEDEVNGLVWPILGRNVVYIVYGHTCTDGVICTKDVYVTGILRKAFIADTP